MNELRVALAGLGTVGGGLWKNLLANADLIERRVDTKVSITRVLCRRRERAAELGVPSDFVVSTWQELLADTDTDVVVELMGGTSEAFEFVRSALEAKKHVVTANKALLAAHGEELFTLAAKQQKQLLFEASVAGGIPFIQALREGLAGNHIQSVHGIVNGTCNYILTQMAETGADYAQVLAEAKRLGYAEAEESLDVDGHDAAHKAAIIAALAYGFWVPEEQLYTEGIRNITSTDLMCASELGYTVKHLAVIRQSDGGAEVRVHPTLVPSRHILASIDGVFNAIMVTGDVVGETLFYGPGAGADATASAVLADLAQIAADHPGTPRVRAIGIEEICPKVRTIDEITSRYYLRLCVEDKPGVLAQVASILGERNIGISSVIQPDSIHDENAMLIIMLHDSRESDLNGAVEAIAALDCVKDRPFRLRVEDFE